MAISIDKALLAEAESFYDPKLAYHNFSHINYVFAAAESIIERCRQNGLQPDETVVFLALLFHDAGFIEDHKAKGFDSKEAYSATIAKEVLAKHGYEASTINKISQAIMSTHCDERCQSIEDKIVKGADLSGLADSYEVFLDNAIKLKDEYELFNNHDIAWRDWKDMAIKRLLLFIDDEMELTDKEFNEAGESLFRNAVISNVERLRKEPAP